MKFSDTEFSEDEDSSTTLKKARPTSSSDESETTTTPSESENEESNLKSSGEETPESPCDNNNQEYDDLWYSPVTPARDRSGAIDLEDPEIRRGDVFRSFRDPDDIFISSTENSPNSVSSSTLSSLHDYENQNPNTVNDTLTGIRLNFGSLGMTFIGDTDLSS